MQENQTTDSPWPPDTMPKKPNCLLGCAAALIAPVIGAFLLSCSIYAAQAIFNPRPLQHDMWGLTYLLTIPIGAIAALLTVCVYWAIYEYWQYWPRKRWFALAFAVFTLIFCIWAYNPGDPSDPDDPSFTLD